MASFRVTGISSFDPQKIRENFKNTASISYKRETAHEHEEESVSVIASAASTEIIHNLMPQPKNKVRVKAIPNSVFLPEDIINASETSEAKKTRTSRTKKS